MNNNINIKINVVLLLMCVMSNVMTINIIINMCVLLLLMCV